MRKKHEAKQMLEEYLGYTKHSGKFIEDAIAPDGKSIGHWEKEEFVKGAIQSKLDEAEQLREASNLGDRFKGRTFTSFDKKRDPAAFEACSKYANNQNIMKHKKNGLILYGGYGNGKTHLAAAVADVLIRKGIPVLFGTSIEHFNFIRDEFDKAGQKTYLTKMKTVPVLVIDDLGKEKKTEWTTQTLFDVINYRYEHMLPTIITTNLESGAPIANHTGGAVWSRFNEMCHFVKTTGGDYRKGKR